MAREVGRRAGPVGGPGLEQEPDHVAQRRLHHRLAVRNMIPVILVSQVLSSVLLMSLSSLGKDRAPNTPTASFKRFGRWHGTPGLRLPVSTSIARVGRVPPRERRAQPGPRLRVGPIVELGVGHRVEHPLRGGRLHLPGLQKSLTTGHTVLLAWNLRREGPETEWRVRLSAEAFAP